MKEDNELNYRPNGLKVTVVYPSKDIQRAVSGIDGSAAQSFWESVDGKEDPVGNQDWPERARSMEREEGLGQSLKNTNTERMDRQAYEKTKKK